MNESIVPLSHELLAMLATGKYENALAPFSREVYLLDITVAGTSYCEQIDDVFPKLAIGEVLKMQRDPHNKHDNKAIGIYYDAVRIGWIPRQDNLVISRLMDAGKAFFCRITELEETASHWKRIDCKVYMVE